MDRRTFKNFIRRAHLRSFSEGGQICHDGNNFSGPFYVAMINPSFKIVYIKKGKEYFEVKENSWIGVIEYMMYEKNKIKTFELERKQTKNIDETTTLKKKTKIPKVKWGLDAVVRERLEEINDDNKLNDDNIFQEEDDPCYVYEFPLGVVYL